MGGGVNVIFKNGINSSLNFIQKPYLSLLLVFFALATMFSSCNEAGFDVASNASNSIVESSKGDCIQVFTYDNQSVPLDLRKMGYYHNQILVQFIRPPFIYDMCERNDYLPIQQKIDNIIASSTEYSDFFDNAQTTGCAGYYLDILKICNTSNPNPDSLMLALVDKTCDLLANYLTSYEITFIKTFFADGLSGNLEPIINYVNIIEQNRSKFIANGNLSLGLLSIYDNSYCFWSEKYQLSNINRACLLCKGTAIGDVVNAFYEGAKDIYDHGGEPSDKFLKKMGRGALEGSAPFGGGDIASWLGW